MSALYATEAIARDRWERAGATGDDLARLADEHIQLTPQQRADLAAEIATCSDSDLAGLLERRRGQVPVVTAGKIRTSKPVSSPAE